MLSAVFGFEVREEEVGEEEVRWLQRCEAESFPPISDSYVARMYSFARKRLIAHRTQKTSSVKSRRSLGFQYAYMIRSQVGGRKS